MSFDVFRFLICTDIARKKCQTSIRKCVFLPCLTGPGATLAFEIYQTGDVNIDALSGTNQKQETISTFLTSFMLESNGKALTRRYFCLVNSIRQSPSKASIGSTQKRGPASMDASHLNLASLSLHTLTTALQGTRQKTRHVQSVLVCAPSFGPLSDGHDNFVRSFDQNTSNGENSIYGIQYSGNKEAQNFSHAEAAYIFEVRAQAPVCPLIGSFDIANVKNVNGPRVFASCFALQLTEKVISNDCFVNTITNTLGVCQESMRLAGQINLRTESHQRNPDVIGCHASAPSLSSSIHVLMKVTEMERRNKIRPNCHGEAKRFGSESLVITVLQRTKASTKHTSILWRKELCMEIPMSRKDKYVMRPSVNGAGHIITGGLGGIGSLICHTVPEGSIVISRRGYSKDLRISNLNFTSIHK